MVSVRRKVAEGHRHRRCTSASYVAQVHMAEARQITQMVIQQAWRPQDLELRHLCQRFEAIAAVVKLLALQHCLPNSSFGAVKLKRGGVGAKLAVSTLFGVFYFDQSVSQCMVGRVHSGV